MGKGAKIEYANYHFHQNESRILDGEQNLCFGFLIFWELTRAYHTTQYEIK